MRIGIDAHGVGGYSRGLGNETYFRNLIASLAAIDSENEYHVFVDHPGVLSRLVGDRPNVRLVSLRPRSQWLQRPLSLPWYALRHRLDVLHCPFVRPPLCATPTIVTVHDICFEVYPQFFTRVEAWRMKALVPRSCRRADLIFTVSELARDQIHDLYGVPADKIVITPNAADHIRPHARPPSREYESPYLLYVGLIQPRKNLARLVRAFDLMIERSGLPHQLLLAGSWGWRNGELSEAIAGARRPERVHLLGYCPTERVAELLAGSDGFVFPSLFESFGIPAMEAQRSGVPALVADGSCFPEIYADSVLYCDPLDVDSIATAMQRLITDRALRARLVERGFRRAAMYTWERTARIALEAYRRVAGGANRASPGRPRPDVPPDRLVPPPQAARTSTRLS
jgi:glycosyltransferase involved in cell wall biosynthesis